jgi:transglutaminase-like putative cysteine protease
MVEGGADGLGIIAAEFPVGVKPVLTLTSRVMTRHYTVDLARPARFPKAERSELEYFLRPTKLLPTNGIVKEAATEITSAAKTEIEKARAIYEWIVDNTFRNPKTRGCGIGDIRFMLESKNLGGKCADLNALYVGLARAPGLPARDVYGIRVAKSELGYKSLGVASENIAKASTAAPKCISAATAGFRLIPLTCGKLCSRNRLETERYTTRSSRKRERGSLAPGR